MFLNTSRGGDSTASLGRLLQFLTTLSVKEFSEFFAAMTWSPQAPELAQILLDLCVCTWMSMNTVTAWMVNSGTITQFPLLEDSLFQRLWRTQKFSIELLPLNLFSCIFALMKTYCLTPQNFDVGERNLT